MGEGILFRSGEALVASGPPGTAAEPEVIVGSLAGPVGIAMAHLIGEQLKSDPGLESRVLLMAQGVIGTMTG